MSTIGIIGAMEEEIEHVKPLIEIISTKNIVGLDFYMGKMGGNNVVLVRCGIGKVNAAICSQVLIDLYAVDCIINVGVSGSVNKDLKIGDIVVSTDTMQHDVDTTCFGDELGVIPRMNCRSFKADETLMKLAIDCADLENDGNVYAGRIISGDKFICDLDAKNTLWNNFKAHCVDMESAAIGHTCYLNKLPFVIIRSISDTCDDNNPSEYENFFVESAKKASLVLKHMIEKI